MHCSSAGCWWLAVFWADTFGTQPIDPGSCRCYGTPVSSRETSPGNFGLLIVYVIPGFTALGGLPSPATTLSAKALIGTGGEASLAGFLYVTVEAITAGLIVSAVRWLMIDTLHHRTGLRRPLLDFASLDRNVSAFEFLVQSHYWFYQFYANMVVALVWAYFMAGDPRDARGWVYGPLAILFFLASRDALRKYYERAGDLLRPGAGAIEATAAGHG